ncbi:J domain-containing protein [Bradyrhizobium sp.]|uniref:J domain-containing protein n=1 Tax=Bradyrhizobium sp. TaxID=376 RepID=UPI0026164767|nr:J domain-containing protein [Bradyrhizobium sp.]
MDTLYDLLGALPHDDAESLRTAFRRAVKSAHPDLRPDDPDAGTRFRQIVRANEILLDKDQRAVYDHLLVLAQQEKDPAAAHPIAAKVHKIASTVLALASLSIVTAGGYFLFMHMSMALVPPVSLAVAHAPASDLTTRLSASIAAVSPADAPDPAAISAFIAAKAEGNAANPQNPSNAMAMVTADTENATSTGSIGADRGGDSASLSHARVASVLAIAGANAAPAEPEHVAQIDQTFTAPYVDRGLLFFHERKEYHPFPDLPPLRHAEKPGHPKSLLAPNGKEHTDALPKSVPLPVPRTVQRVSRPHPWYVSSTFQ